MQLFILIWLIPWSTEEILDLFPKLLYSAASVQRKVYLFSQSSKSEEIWAPILSTSLYSIWEMFNTNFLQVL